MPLNKINIYIFLMEAFCIHLKLYIFKYTIVSHSAVPKATD